MLRGEGAHSVRAHQFQAGAQGGEAPLHAAA